MRVCSLLPSATEIVFALGAEDQLVGVTFECDYPPAAHDKPIVVTSLLSSGLTPAEIDAAVRAQAAAGSSLYVVDLPLLQQLEPDLLITQDLCNVCAVNTPNLARTLAQLPSHPQILSLSPHSLDDVLADIAQVGQAIGRTAQAHTLVSSLRQRIDRITTSLAPRPRVLALEWLDPLYQGGHWIPEMIALAGGIAVLATPGAKSVRISWQQVRAAQPEIIILMPCGFNLEQTVAQFHQLTFPSEWHSLPAVQAGRVFAVDGTAFFSRPGPRLIDGLEILHAILTDAPLEDLPSSSAAHLMTRV